MNGLALTAQYAPYQSLTTRILPVLKQLRTKPVPDRFDNQFLQSAGIDEDFARARRTFEFFTFIDSGGVPTEVAHRYHNASEDEARLVLQGALRVAYRDIFARVDPETAARQLVEKAFADKLPTKLQSRMAALFLGLCNASGMNVSIKGSTAQPISPRQESLKQESLTRLPFPANGEQRPHDPKGQRTTPRLISFGHAGSITVSVEVDLIDLAPEIMETVLNFVNATRALEKAAQGLSSLDR